MSLEAPILAGRHVRLEPLTTSHVAGLLEAARADPSLYGRTFVPQTEHEMNQYAQTALDWQDAGTAIPFATVRLNDGMVIGSTRYFLIEHWAWPEGHPRHGRGLPDACEIGYTWLTSSAIRTAANTEAKLLMLTHAFEDWDVVRVCFHTDARNERSRAALERIGAKFEGILRSHRLAADFPPRDSARFSIVIEEWPRVKARMGAMLKGD